MMLSDCPSGPWRDDVRVVCETFDAFELVVRPDGCCHYRAEGRPLQTDREPGSRPRVAGGHGIGNAESWTLTAEGLTSCQHPGEVRVLCRNLPAMLSHMRVLQ